MYCPDKWSKKARVYFMWIMKRKFFLVVEREIVFYLLISFRKIQFVGVTYSSSNKYNSTNFSCLTILHNTSYKIVPIGSLLEVTLCCTLRRYTLSNASKCKPILIWLWFCGNRNLALIVMYVKYVCQIALTKDAD